MNTYLFALAMSINGTGQFLAWTLGIFMAGGWVIRTIARCNDAPYEHVRTPQWFLPLWFAGLIAATVMPHRDQLLAAVAIDQGPVVAKQLIDALKDD